MRRGLGTAALALALLLGAALLGSVALFAFALGLLAAVAGSVLVALLAARSIVVERTVAPLEVLEGQPLTLSFELRGLRRIPAHAELLVAGGRWLRLDDHLASRCTIERPGPYVVSPSQLRVRDDLGLFSRRLSSGEPQVVLVLPAPAKVEDGGRGSGTDPIGDPEPDGLRSYSHGTPASRIHWPSVARGGEWQERHIITAPRGAPLVVVDLAGAPSEAAVDWALRAAAGQIYELARAGGCRVLLPGEWAPTQVGNVAASWQAIHRRLAGLRAERCGAAAAAPAGALLVRAAHAPVVALPPPRSLPPGVMPLEESSYARAAAGP
jgi:uncharacterized protein (DUF58 family)